MKQADILGCDLCLHFDALQLQAGCWPDKYKCESISAYVSDRLQFFKQKVFLFVLCLCVLCLHLYCPLCDLCGESENDSRRAIQQIRSLSNLYARISYDTDLVLQHVQEIASVIVCPAEQSARQSLFYMVLWKNEDLTV